MVGGPLRARFASRSRNALPFIESERAIDVLQGLRRRTLEQVIERRDDDDALAAGSEREAADLGMPNSLMKPSASATPQSADCA